MYGSEVAPSQIFGYPHREGLQGGEDRTDGNSRYDGEESQVHDPTNQV